jgi:hypothetical protein
MRMGTEFLSCVVTISRTKLKQCANSLEDPSDGKPVERMIKKYLEHGIENARVEYAVKYQKKQKQRILESNVDGNPDNEDVENLIVKKTKVIYFHFHLIEYERN